MFMVLFISFHFFLIQLQHRTFFGRVRYLFLQSCHSKPDHRKSDNSTMAQMVAANVCLVPSHSSLTLKHCNEVNIVRVAQIVKTFM